MTVSAVSFHLFPKAEAASLEGKQEKCSHDRRKTHRANTFTHGSVHSPGPTPHRSSACFLAEQLIVLTGAPTLPRQVAKSLRKRALSSCNIRDMAETVKKENAASAIKLNQGLSCRAPMLRLEGNLRADGSQLSCYSHQPESKLYPVHPGPG